MTVPTVIVQEANGSVTAIDPGVDKTLLVIGCSNLGGDPSPPAVTLFGTAGGLYSLRGEGPGQRLGGVILQSNPGDVIIAFVNTPSTNPGTFGTPDLSGLVGTVNPDFAGPPLNDYDLRFTVTDDGNGGAGTNIGTTGILYTTSEDDGRNVNGPFLLGTAGQIVFTGDGVTCVLNPPLSALETSVNALRTALLGHYTDVSGGTPVHAASDTTDETALSAVPAATSYATAIAAFNACLSTLKTHVASAVYHTVADTVATTALSAITTAATAQDVVARLPAVIAAYEAHRVLVGGGPVHGSADNTNTCAASTAAHGTLKTGDIVRVHCNGPKWAVADLDAAFSAAAQSNVNFGGVAIAGPVSATEAAHVVSGLNTLKARGKRCFAIFSARIMNPAESEATWAASVQSDYASFADDRVTVCATPSRCTLDDGNRVRQFDTDAMAVIAARLVSNQLMAGGLVSYSPSEVGRLGALPGVSITDANGSPLATAHDEAGAVQGLDSAHFLTLMRLPDPSRAQGVYITRPWVMFPQNGPIGFLPSRRVVNKGERVMVAVGFGELGSKQVFVPDGNGGGSLSVPAMNVLKGQLRGPVSLALTGEVSNSDDPNLVTVDQTVVVLSPDEIQVTAYLNITKLRYVGKVVLNVIIK